MCRYLLIVRTLFDMTDIKFYRIMEQFFRRIEKLIPYTIWNVYIWPYSVQNGAAKAPFTCNLALIDFQKMDNKKREMNKNPVIVLLNLFNRAFHFRESRRKIICGSFFFCWSNIIAAVCQSLVDVKCEMHQKDRIDVQNTQRAEYKQYSLSIQFPRTFMHEQHSTWVFRTQYKEALQRGLIELLSLGLIFCLFSHL